MNPNYLEQAKERISNIPLLINVVSRRVRQLNQGHRPMVKPDNPDAVWVIGDYHLQSQAGRWDPEAWRWWQDRTTSPCIDAGDPTSPVGREPPPNGGIIDLGAYGGTTEASKSASRAGSP